MYKLRDNVTQHTALHLNIKQHISLNLCVDAHFCIYKCILGFSNTYKHIFLEGSALTGGVGLGANQDVLQILSCCGFRNDEFVGNNILMTVKDQGIGISKAAQKRIFEEFYREHTGDVHNVKGHGLGLSNVKRIIDNHQGSIAVESEKGKGSIFTIKLPLIT